MGLIEPVFALCRISLLIGNLHIKGFAVASTLYSFFFFLLISTFSASAGRALCAKGVVFTLQR